MQAAIILNGRKLIPVGAGFMHGAYLIVSHDDTYLLMPTASGEGYRIRSDTRGWERTFPSLHGAVAYVNAIDAQEREPGTAA